MNIDKKTSGTLMIANLAATILVIAIHYNTKSSAEGLNYLVQEYLTNGIARIAVPFVALMSGFFMAKTILKKPYTEIIYNKSKTLLIPYLLGSSTVLLAYLAKEYFYYANSSLNISFQWLIKAIFIRPESEQFWFLRDLIILTIATPILININRNMYVLMAIVVGSMWSIDYQPFPVIAGWYFLNIETLFFFILGGLLFKNKALLNWTVNSNRKLTIFIFCLWLASLAIRVYLDPQLNVWYAKEYTLTSILLYKFAILIGILSLIQISASIYSNQKLVYLSGLTFFAYLYHLAPLSFFRIVTSPLIREGYGFYINFPIALIAVFFVAHCTSKIQPNLFAFITGGRNPNKALKRTQ